MKRILVLLLLASLPAVAQTIRIPEVSRHRLDNGLTVLLMEAHNVPLVHYRMIVRGGAARDPEGLEGAAAVTASLLREGTETRDAGAIARAVDFIGGTLTVSAGLDYCAAVAEALAKDADTCLALFADVILHPTFPDDELARERKQRLAALEAIRENPGALASMVFTRTVYGGHPYGRQTNGTRASLDALRRRDLQEFYRSVFVPANAVLVVAGDFRSEEMLGKIGAAFGAWSGGAPDTLALPAPEAPQGRNVVIIDKPDATQTQIRMGGAGITIRHPDYFPVMVANTIFGSGFTSRLVEELRVKRSLTYGAGSSFSSALAGGIFSIGTFTRNETAGEAVDVVFGELKKFRDQGAGAEELRKARNYMAGNFARSLQTSGAIAARLTDIELYNFPADHLRRYVERIQGVGGGDVRRAAELFPHENLVLVLLGPADSLRTAAERYGPVTVLSMEEALR